MGFLNNGMFRTEKQFGSHFSLASDVCDLREAALHLNTAGARKLTA